MDETGYIVMGVVILVILLGLMVTQLKEVVYIGHYNSTRVDNFERYYFRYSDIIEDDGPHWE